MDNQKLEGCRFICIQKEIVFKLSQGKRFEICEKKKIPRWFQIFFFQYYRFVVDQCKIAANEHKQVYLEIK